MTSLIRNFILIAIKMALLASLTACISSPSSNMAEYSYVPTHAQTVPGIETYD